MHRRCVLSMTYERRGDCTQGFFTDPSGAVWESKQLSLEASDRPSIPNDRCGPLQLSYNHLFGRKVFVGVIDADGDGVLAGVDRVGLEFEGKLL